MSADVEAPRPMLYSSTSSDTSATTSHIYGVSCNSSTTMASSMSSPSQPLSVSTAPSNIRNGQLMLEPQQQRMVDDSSAQKTPTRDSFFGSERQSSDAALERLSRPSSFPASQPTVKVEAKDAPAAPNFPISTSESLTPSSETQQKETSLGQDNKQENINSANRLSIQSAISEDVAMDDAADDEVDGDGGSDLDSNASDRPTKKKKGQRFFCTDYPPCSLSFTRSEHLARHIRKHTGERPFQCHCLRRFSRLDNLRQHAQTVHVNEEIPGDSLAATGTRFQRQIRTDRMRTPAGRHRASTISSVSGVHSRGHSRNWSNSSIGSIASELGTPDELRRRPPTLAMAQASPSRPLTIDTYSTRSSVSDNTTFSGYFNANSSGFSTPISSRYSTVDSPSGLRSPITMTSRPTSYGGDSSHTRRLSVPSTTNPFTYTSPSKHYMSPILSSTASTFPSKAQVFASPTTATSDNQGGQGEAADEYRRRTWHPSSNLPSSARPSTSGLGHYQASNAIPSQSNAAAAAPPPMVEPPANSQNIRLPGIASFDLSGPPRRVPSPMDVDEQAARASSLADARPETRGSRDSWGSISHHMTQLDLDNLASAPRDASAWKFPATTTATHVTAEPRRTPPLTTTGAPRTLSHGSYHRRAVTHDYIPSSRVILSARPPVPSRTEPVVQLSDPPMTPRKKKRQAWYNGPLQSLPTTTSAAPQTNSYAAQRTSPEGSTGSESIHTPTALTGSDYHPAIVHSNGTIESHNATSTGLGDSSKFLQNQEMADIKPVASQHSQSVDLTTPSSFLRQGQPLTSANIATAQPFAGTPESQSLSKSLGPEALGHHPIERAGPSSSLPLRVAHEQRSTDRLDALVAVATEASQSQNVPSHSPSRSESQIRTA